MKELKDKLKDVKRNECKKKQFKLLTDIVEELFKDGDKICGYDERLIPDQAIHHLQCIHCLLHYVTEYPFYIPISIKGFSK